jgi:hypothetical protein
LRNCKYVRIRRSRGPGTLRRSPQYLRIDCGGSPSWDGPPSSDSHRQRDVEHHVGGFVPWVQTSTISPSPRGQAPGAPPRHHRQPSRASRRQQVLIYRSPINYPDRATITARTGAASRHRVITTHDGGRRPRHVNDPQPLAGGCSRLEAAHSVPPEIRTCDRRSGKLTQSCRPSRTISDYPLRFAARNEAQRKLGRSPQYLAERCGGPPSSDGHRQPSRITSTTTDDDNSDSTTTADSRQREPPARATARTVTASRGDSPTATDNRHTITTTGQATGRQAPHTDTGRRPGAGPVRWRKRHKR